MEVYIVNIETRKHDRDETLGPFTTFDKARQAVLEYEDWTEEKWKNYTEFDSSWENGTIYTEEHSVEIYERELK